MNKPLDLTPKFSLLPAEQEIYVPPPSSDQPVQMVGGWRADSQQFSQGKMIFQANSERILVGDATEPMTGVGIFIGKDGSDYEFRVGDPNGDYFHWNGMDLIINGYAVDSSIACAASDVLAKSADTTRGVDQNAYTKYKEIAVDRGGSYRIEFEIRNSTGSGTTSGRIYINGVATGTERSNGTTSFVNYSQDLTLLADDLVQIYCKKTIDNGEVRNFRIKATLIPGATVTLD